MLIIALLLVVFSNFGNDVNLLGLMLLLVYLGSIFIFRPVEYANNLLYFIILIPMLVGGMLIERGAYLFEIDQYSYWNGTFIVNLFFSMIFIEFLIYPIKSRRIKSSLVFDRRLFDLLVICVIITLYGTFLKTGIPLFNNIHRSIYFGSIVPEYINIIKGRLSFVCLALGYYYFNYRSKKYLLYFFLIVLYHLLCSIKGGELLVVIYSFSLPITLFYSANSALSLSVKLNKKIRTLLLLLVCGLFGIIFINYQTVENYDSKTTALEKVQKRVEAAGQIWWTINDNNQVSQRIRWDLFLKNFNEDGDKFERGMNQLMNVVAPAKYLSAWRSDTSRGQSLANGFPAIGYYYFGYTGIILLILTVGSLIILIKRDVLSSFESGDILSFLFLGPLLEVIIRVTAQGDINLLFEKRTLVIFIAYIVYSLSKGFLIRVKTV
ncbi:DUF6418 domain-containing protein [Lelliottia nimipressuralis]|uniref:DUF6418 domain-containing protein n=1 Tax=Lelliottia nimipressuralis TaxID=69220 RepID=A0ABY3P0J9_9ENTR|nr:DUF6418 domain-containing protein [Lelliottia nimipressuralis]RXJ11587.1 hypothetical protein ETG88_17475 [Lelliottia nimipressuralis]TYT32243.1 hypothetical protein FZO59_13415 [Lelliottia nimipressuralis]